MSKRGRRPVVRHALVQVGSRILSPAESAEILAQVSASLRERGERERLSRRAARIESLPIHRRSVERAMLAVEEKFVKALWVLQRAIAPDGPTESKRNGLPYLHEGVDRYGQAIEAGGWIAPPPRPGLPSSREIDEAAKAQAWLRFLDPTEARVLTIGAMSKRGDAGRKVSWVRVRARLPELKYMSERSLRHTYTAALRNIVSSLTEQRLRA